jgi:hypothetical protein
MSKTSRTKSPTAPTVHVKSSAAPGFWFAWATAPDGTLARDSRGGTLSALCGSAQGAKNLVTAQVKREARRV